MPLIASGNWKSRTREAPFRLTSNFQPLPLPFNAPNDRSTPIFDHSMEFTSQYRPPVLSFRMFRHRHAIPPTRPASLPFRCLANAVLPSLASFVFILLRTLWHTLLHGPKHYLQSFQRLPHSLRKTPGGVSSAGPIAHLLACPAVAKHAVSPQLQSLQSLTHTLRHTWGVGAICTLPSVKFYSNSSSRRVPLPPGGHGAKMIFAGSARSHRETSPLFPVSNTGKADIGSGYPRKPLPFASRSPLEEDRTSKKAWVQRSH